MPPATSALLYRLRNRLAAVPVAAALLASIGHGPAGPVCWSCAVLLCTAGVVVRAWASFHNHYGQGRKHGLATHGPYRLVRNPLYWGNTLVLSGATAASGMTWLVPVTAAWALLVYVWVVAVEETRLVAKYGDAYRRYAARTPAWLPVPRTLSRCASPYVRPLLRQMLGLLALLPFLVKALLA